MSFMSVLVEKAKPYIEASLDKPFLLGILNGDLPLDIFQFWLRVDYPYLINFARVEAAGITKARTLHEMQVMFNMLNWTLNGEMALHRSYCAKFGIRQEELFEQRMNPTKHAYSVHQLAAAYGGSLAEVLAAALPCEVMYGGVGKGLVEKKPVAPENPYRDWLATYTSEGKEDAEKETFELFELLASECSERQRTRLQEIFMTGMHYELDLWDKYYEKEWW